MNGQTARAFAKNYARLWKTLAMLVVFAGGIAAASLLTAALVGLPAFAYTLYVHGWVAPKSVGIPSWVGVINVIWVVFLATLVLAAVMTASESDTFEEGSE